MPAADIIDISSSEEDHEDEDEKEKPNASKNANANTVNQTDVDNTLNAPGAGFLPEESDLPPAKRRKVEEEEQDAQVSLAAPTATMKTTRRICPHSLRHL